MNAVFDPFSLPGGVRARQLILAQRALFRTMQTLDVGVLLTSSEPDQHITWVSPWMRATLTERIVQGLEGSLIAHFTKRLHHPNIALQKALCGSDLRFQTQLTLIGGYDCTSPRDARVQVTGTRDPEGRIGLIFTPLHGH
jgi:hypothetical protein